MDTNENIDQDKSENRTGAGRTQKATDPKEVVLLTSNLAAPLPEWLEMAHTYLEDKIEDILWKKCIFDWIAFEHNVLVLCKCKFFNNK